MSAARGAPVELGDGSLLLDFERDVYLPGPADDPAQFVLSGTLRSEFPRLVAGREVVVWSETLSPHPAGIIAMAGWLRMTMPEVIRQVGRVGVELPDVRPELLAVMGGGS